MSHELGRSSRRLGARRTTGGAARPKADEVSGAIPTAELIAQQHEPRGAVVHLVILAGVVVTALMVIGMSRWRKRHARPERHPGAHDHPEEKTRPQEPK
jgi:hypothetical protein